MMDTTVNVRAIGKNAEKAVDEAFQRLEKIENLMSVTIEDSDIYRINENPGKPVTVDPRTIEVLKRTIKYSELTEGNLDPSIGPLINLWNIDGNNPTVPTDEDINGAKQFVDYRQIIINEEKNTVTLPQEGMSLDLGAVVKG
ncbi:MAG: FAD:protein FMN transferase, partial [Halanaerobiales bacterium]